MLFIRSALFNFYFLCLLTPFVCLVGLPIIIFPGTQKVARLVAGVWAWGTVWGLRILCGITHRAKGLENIPDEPCIFACKHQSAWETMIFFIYDKRPVYVLKAELCNIPVFGNYLKRMEMISVKRDDGMKALKSLTQQAAERLKEGRSLVIFPEGTRTAPGERPPLQPGIASIYNAPDIHVPVVPVALNSGKLWGKGAFIKKPGVITIHFLPPLSPDMKRKDFMAQLEEILHTESEKLG